MFVEFCRKIFLAIFDMKHYNCYLLKFNCFDTDFLIFSIGSNSTNSGDYSGAILIKFWKMRGGKRLLSAFREESRDSSGAEETDPLRLHQVADD